MAKQMLIGISIFFLLFSTASALEIGGVQLPDTVQIENNNLVLNGAGIRRKYGFKVYVIGLYLKAKSQDGPKTHLYHFQRLKYCNY